MFARGDGASLFISSSDRHLARKGDTESQKKIEEDLLLSLSSLRSTSTKR